ncbi:GNAT family N-acetyltransferase [Microvirgula curvata]|uniref:N-acetyltransferase n=1 Tax=Microvirgula aerodenitrificans TaxID=57480 RepID=A0A2S0P9Y1_9NEIS|nr:GNAT family N-acetyltransferase [Microvirgula aerodenitrificans]AVY94188.1 N-acetyltransferase [Microvirgula aerodenitrificans]
MRCADLHLRAAVAADAAAIARIHTESWQLDYRDILKHAYLDDEAPAERLALWLSRMGGDAPPRVLLAESADGVVLGFVCVFPDVDSRFGALLDNLHVAPAARGRGIGRRLLAEACRELRTYGQSGGMHLWVYAANRSASGFFRRYGGSEVTRETIVTPDGGTTISLCYHWPNLDMLAADTGARDSGK